MGSSKINSEASLCRARTISTSCFCAGLSVSTRRPASRGKRVLGDQPRGFLVHRPPVRERSAQKLVSEEYVFRRRSDAAPAAIPDAPSKYRCGAPRQVWRSRPPRLSSAFPPRRAGACRRRFSSRWTFPLRSRRSGREPAPHRRAGLPRSARERRRTICECRSIQEARGVTAMGARARRGRAARRKFRPRTLTTRRPGVVPAGTLEL